MLRKSFIVAVVLLLAAAGRLYAGQSVQEGLETKLVTNGEFLKAAAKIISEERSDEAASVLRLAESSRDEAIIHLKSGEYELAIEDVNDSNRKAVHAIILSRSSNDRALREAVMREEVSLMAERERVRKEAQLKKGLAEVEIFIKAAERLLKDTRNETAALKLKETKEVYAASKEKASLGDYDKALEDVSRAYKLATAAVKDIKRSQGDILTFPKAAYTEQKDILAHELKKNDAYAFFASTMVKEGQGESFRLVSEGLTYRESAMKAVKDGGDAQAINDLRASTELLIKALRYSGN